MKRFNKIKLVYFLLSVIAVGCTKESDLSKAPSTTFKNPTKQQQLDLILTDYKTFRHQSDVTVYSIDQSNYIRYRVYSNNENVLASMVNSLENTILEPVKKDVSTTSGSNSRNIEHNQRTFETGKSNDIEDSDKGIFMVELERNLDAHVSAKIQLANPSRGYVETYTTVTIVNYGFAYTVYHLSPQQHGLYYHFYLNNSRKYVLNEIKSSVGLSPSYPFYGPVSYQKLVAVPTGNPTATDPFKFSWTIHPLPY